MAKQNQKPKKNKTRNQKTNGKTQLSATTPPLGVCSLVFLGLFLGFLVSYFSSSLLIFSAMANKTKNQKKQETRTTRNQKKQKRQTPKNDKTQLSATTPPIGVCNLVFLFFFGFWVFWFLVFWSMLVLF